MAGLTMARTLQHLDDGTPCPGAYDCEKCRLDWMLKGQVYYRVQDDGDSDDGGDGGGRTADHG